MFIVSSEWIADVGLCSLILVNSWLMPTIGSSELLADDGLCSLVLVNSWLTLAHVHWF